ncbi:26S proteasome regulatory subunit 6B homolog [Phragmites australis]|uniref:26S proteasome regulatory subunit 6B homolog n=1 Tax=Phragmites australis TaxID=29695 RepID=UPI002D78426E|nr:26S proteasome regulatory subunit 6B homolog [Phragmites australis]
MAAALHQMLSCPADFSGLNPPELSPAEAVYEFAHGEVGDDADLHEQLHSLERELAQLELREEQVRIEMGELRREVQFDEEMLTLVQGATPLVVGHLDEVVGDDHAVVTIAESSRSLYMRVLSTVDRGLLKLSANVLLSARSCAIVGVLPADAGSAVASSLVADAERPSVTYDDIAGCEEQKQEVREAIELPLTHPELFARLGVDPPRGVLLCGPPGTGKTMLSKAVAHHTSAAFIRVNGAELVNKFLGKGATMVRDVFRLAREKAPSIIFIDEVDAVATARFDASSGADREVQRVLVELLTQMDGFDGSADNVRMIMATNRADALDPALLRPGRLDRRVEFPLPDTRQKRLVFQACAARMNLDGDVDMEELAARHDRMSAAEIAAVCFEAGMRAVRGHRCVVTREDLDQGYRSVAKRPECGAYHELSFYS